VRILYMKLSAGKLVVVHEGGVGSGEIANSAAKV